MNVNSLKNKFSKWKGIKEQWLIVLCAGILLLIIAMPTDKKTDHTEQTKEENNVTLTTDRYIDEMERRLEFALEQIEGVGKTTVMITLSSSSEKIIEKDMESRTSSSSSSDKESTSTNDLSEQSVYSSSSDGDIPYVKQELYPTIEGVLVVAKGGDDAVVKQNITEVVQALFGVDTHKIRVMKHN